MYWQSIAKSYMSYNSRYLCHPLQYKSIVWTNKLSMCLIGYEQVYIEDALNERWWVECSWCECLVENMVTAFSTKQPPPHLIPSDNALGQYYKCENSACRLNLRQTDGQRDYNRLNWSLEIITMIAGKNWKWGLGVTSYDEGAVWRAWRPGKHYIYTTGPFRRRDLHQLLPTHTSVS